MEKANTTKEARVPNKDVKSMKAPSFLKLIEKELIKDKAASMSLLILIGILLTVFICATFLNSPGSIRINLEKLNQGPSSEYLLGTDASGRDMLPQLFQGARNSFLIAFGVTLFGGIFGTLVGLCAGFYGGKVDHAMMRLLDFISMLPRLMFIIVLVSLIPNYNVTTFILIITAFSWISDARLIRAKTLQQNSLDYVQASKTLGTSNIVIMFREVLPNIGSMIIVNLTLNLAGNMGLETGLTFLGFGLPFNTPSLGTLIGYAATPENIQRRWWQWLPAAILIFTMMLCINFVGQAVKRAADSRQRAA
ncbi:MAG: binding--dependent transport system inner rane component family protein [Herbinix sp.]|jgi:peptide/nickel transport system permease protein|nr:binding--dependent transport system inner rane component family protein [Herbinix sp.]